ncbi:MAG: AsmA family protein, partial [Muribaculaceae bacterium]|nr:AsmA family protein [Muribaculaceae bacterium]
MSYLCKLKYKVIKNSTKITLIVIITLAVLLITPFILLSNNKIQNFVVDKITEYLEEKTGAEFEIEHVAIKFFNKFNLYSIEVSDLNNQKILSIDNLNAEISLLSLLKGDLHIESITANDLDAYLYTNPDGSLNI